MLQRLLQRRARREQGFALLLVLWTTVLLVLIATQIVAAGRVETRLAASLRSAAAAAAIADGAVHEAMFRLLLPPGEGWEADGTPHAMHLPPWDATVTVLDLAGRVNPNRASPELLAALLRRLGQEAAAAASLSQAILAWRFPGATPTAVDADTRRYREAGRNYAPPHAPFQSVEELSFVLGMTPALMARLSPHVSVDTVADPDPARADPVVLESLREVTGQTEFARVLSRAPVRVVVITAIVTGLGRVRATRRAVVRLGTLPGGPSQILVWGIEPG